LGGVELPDYKKMYFQLFNKITDAITILQKVQIECEEIYIENEKPAIIIPLKTHPVEKET